MLGTAFKMIRNVGMRPASYLVVALGFGAIALLRWPMVPVVMVLAPVAISLGTAAFVVLSRRNPLWALATGTVANIVALHLTSP